MIISIAKEVLIEPLKHMVGVSEKKQTMPILGNVLIRGTGETLLLVSSDLEVEISTEIAHPVDSAVNTTMPAKKLLDILKSLPGSKPVNIEILETKAVIKSGKSKFTLATI